MVDIDAIFDKFVKIKRESKYQLYNIDMPADKKFNSTRDRDLRPHVNISKERSPYVLAEIAELISNLQLTLVNMRRNEALLRYHTKFFYLFR